MNLIIALTLMVYFVLLIILVLNLTDKSRIIKASFIVFMISLIIVLFFVNEIVMDYIISSIIRYLYYPTFASILLTVMITISLFVTNIILENNKNKEKIINYIFASLILVSYIVFMAKNIDINSVNALYEENSLICLRYISRTFTLWMIINLTIKYFKYLIKKEDENG